MAEKKKQADLLRQDVERLLPEAFRTYIEQEFYAKVNSQAVLDCVANDREFLANPLAHVALFSDHGVVHARDVALHILQVLDSINGVLIPARDRLRLGFMRGYGVMVAYLHDVGMRDFSSFGRAMHPEFAAQLVYTSDFDAMVERLWRENSGNVAWRLLNLSMQGDLPQDPVLVMREMLAMSLCHSKSKVPIDVLNDPALLRQLLRRSISSSLQYLHLLQQVEKAKRKLREAREQGKSSSVLRTLGDREKTVEGKLQRFLNTEGTQQRGNQELSRYYDDVKGDAFLWLVDPKPSLHDLTLDVLDTLRALRCADALRQRGTTYKTSGGYETFIEHRSASAIYALRTQDLSKLFFVRAENPVNAGEANVASSGIDQEGNLRISLQSGAFGDAETTEIAARNAASVIDGIQEDVISSFRHPEASYGNLQPPHKTEHDIQILIEGVDDNPDFARLVWEQLRQINPHAARRCRPVPSLQSAELDEIERYLNANDREWSMEEKRQLLDRLSESGRKVDRIDLTKAFTDVRLIHIEAGQILISGGSPSGFVYIPFGTGLRIFPLGGYAPVSAQAWVSLGDTGVVRGSVRNATIVAEKPVTLLMIPKSVYLEHWYDTYSPEEFARLLSEGILSESITSDRTGAGAEGQTTAIDGS